MDDRNVGDLNATVAVERIDEASEPFVGRWNHLVSTTNWEKGRIILQWRETLIASQASPSEYSDEAWSRRVGGITPQHVGRLRRVAQRFGESSQGYAGLYWSHFQAAIDWDDAEMWLEGAVQNRWSVSKMRRSRCETLGELFDEYRSDADVIESEIDEDFDSATEAFPNRAPDLYAEAGPRPEGPDFGDEGDETAGASAAASGGTGVTIYADEADASGDQQESIEFARPFANLADLPDDLAEAFDAFKLAILHHKTEGWKQVSREDVLASLEALKTLSIAP
jgi:hypothetical protein